MRAWLVITMLIFPLLIGCGEPSTTSQPAGDERILVYVSIPPQKQFAERIGGEHIAIRTLLPPGQSHHTYEPTPKQLVEVSTAQVYFTAGLPFEMQLVSKIHATVPSLNVVDTLAGVPLRRSDVACEHEEHDEHGHHEHEEDELDPHTWMNPRIVKIQAANMCNALIAIDSAHRADYERNLHAFHRDLDQLDQETAAALAPLRGQSFLVYHPAYGYFADAYGLKQVAIEQAGKQPTAKQISQLIEQARRDNIHVIFVQPQFSRHNADTIATEIHGVVVPLDPLAEDYLNNMRMITTAIQKALSPTSPSTHPTTAEIP